jgi:hypothetical protein
MTSAQILKEVLANDGGIARLVECLPLDSR